MKKMVSFVVLGIVSTYVTCSAHPPRNIEVEYRESSHMLEAVITHDVNEPRDHYIEEAEVKVNGEKVVEQKFIRQDTNEIQRFAVYLPDVNAGDMLTFEAHCSRSGKLKVKMVIPDSTRKNSLQ